MKNIKPILLLALLTLSVPCMAQPYQSIFGSNSTSWVFIWAYDWAGQSNLYRDSAHVLTDTVVSGITYKKVRQIYYSPTKLLREDTMTGKVWCRHASPGTTDTVEQLLFDFSLQPGDTFDLSRMTNVVYPGGIDTVASVQIVNGRRHIYFKSTYGFGEPYTMIEGIGANAGVMTDNTHLMLGPYLLCSYKNGQQTSFANQYYSGDCHPPLSVSSVAAKDKYSVYPNPATDFIQIKGDGITNVKMMGIDGRVVKEIDGKQVSRIDIPDVPAGYYLLLLSAADGQRTTMPVMVRW